MKIKNQLNIVVPFTDGVKITAVTDLKKAYESEGNN
jgi:hypothetical protein